MTVLVGCGSTGWLSRSVRPAAMVHRWRNLISPAFGGCTRYGGMCGRFKPG
ncbi:hypothetical protein [Lysobacter gummosus]|uniref:hypothetical protein n=1 Tax=Lysobacter gummosus TaxID=262324 RepID=UPI00362FA4F7